MAVGVVSMLCISVVKYGVDVSIIAGSSIRTYSYAS